MAASPGPGAENRKSGQMEAWCGHTTACRIVIGPEKSLPNTNNTLECPGIPRQRAESTRQRQISELVMAIAEGKPVHEWATNNGVPRRTAYRWAREPKVRAKVETIRRQALDQAVGQMTSNIGMVTAGIMELAQGASSESVRLAALRAVASDMMALSKFGVMEDRMTKIEERLDANARHANRPR